MDIEPKSRVRILGIYSDVKIRMRSVPYGVRMIFPDPDVVRIRESCEWDYWWIRFRMVPHWNKILDIPGSGRGPDPQKFFRWDYGWIRIREIWFRIPEFSWNFCLNDRYLKARLVYYYEKLLWIRIFSESANWDRVAMMGCGSQNRILGLSIC